jgi:outer membrane protein assembly factor BamE
MFLSSRRVFPPRSVLPLIAMALALGACKSVEMPKMPGVTPYRMVIQQGNFISDEMVAQLKPGMTKDQVRFVLGTPLVTDIFHADRWDYVFFRELPGGKREQRNLSVLFQDNKLTRVIGDILPDPNAPKPAPVAKPEAKPEPAPKPAAEAKPAAEPAKPAAETWEPTKQNWGSAPQEEPAKPEPAAQKKEEESKEPEKKEERGFFGRMLERITPGSAQAKPAAEPEAKVEAPKEEEKKAEAEKKAEETPAEEKKERGFFGRMLEKIGL